MQILGLAFGVTQILVFLDMLIFHCDTKSLTLGTRIGNTNILVTKSAKICVTTRDPHASQWNIGCVGSQTQSSRIGHVHFFFFCVDFIRVGSRFSVEYGLKPTQGPNVNGFASQWNIGFKVKTIERFLFYESYQMRYY